MKHAFRSVSDSASWVSIASVRSRRFILLGLLALWPMTTPAADFPTKSVRFVVCNPPGGQIDLLARLSAEKAAAALGQPVVVENKAGAAGRIAVQEILKLPADGYTVMYCGIQIVTMPLFFNDPGYELGKDLVAVAILVDNGGAIGINSAIPAKNLKEFIAYAKANPGKLNYVSYGNNHITLAIEGFKMSEGFSMVPIPFAGTAPSLTALTQGDVHFIDNTVSVLMPLVERGTVRLIAAIGPRRFASAPNLPTAAESGYPDFITPSWYGAYIKGGTPREVAERINKELNAAVRHPDVRAKLEAQDSVVLNMSIDEINKDVQSKFEFFSKIASRLKLEKQ